MYTGTDLDWGEGFPIVIDKLLLSSCPEPINQWTLANTHLTRSLETEDDMKTKLACVTTNLFESKTRNNSRIASWEKRGS